MFLKYSLEFSANGNKSAGILFGALYMFTRKNKTTCVSNLKLASVSGVNERKIPSYLKYLHTEGYINLEYVSLDDADKKVDWLNGVPLYVRTKRYITITQKGEDLFAKDKPFLKLDDEWVSKVPLAQGFRLVIAKFQQIYDLHKHRINTDDPYVTISGISLQKIGDELGLTYLQVSRVVKFLHSLNACSKLYGHYHNRHIDFDTEFFSKSFEEFVDDKDFYAQDSLDNKVVKNSLTYIRRKVEEIYTRLEQRREKKFHNEPKFWKFQDCNYWELWRKWRVKEARFREDRAERFNSGLCDKLAQLWLNTENIYNPQWV